MLCSTLHPDRRKVMPAFPHAAEAPASARRGGGRRDAELPNPHGGPRCVTSSGLPPLCAASSPWNHSGVGPAPERTSQTAGCPRAVPARGWVGFNLKDKAKVSLSLGRNGPAPRGFSGRRSLVFPPSSGKRRQRPRPAPCRHGAGTASLGGEGAWGRCRSAAGPGRAGPHQSARAALL